jgi:hypothetical protein
MLNPLHHRESQFVEPHNWIDDAIQKKAVLMQSVRRTCPHFLYNFSYPINKADAYLIV